MKIKDMISVFVENAVVPKDDTSANVLEEIQNTFELLDGFFKETLAQGEYDILQDECKQEHAEYLVQTAVEISNEEVAEVLSEGMLKADTKEKLQ